MTDLFMTTTAIIVDCYRYELRRIWDDRLPMLVVCMLNPSAADHEKNDPTILALIHFARFWGYGGIYIVNLYAFRASNPAEMFKMGEAAVGPENEQYLAAAVTYASANGGKLLVAWGNDGADRAAFFLSYLKMRGVKMICLGTTQAGHPKHPMARGLHRIPRDQMPIDWLESAA